MGCGRVGARLASTLDTAGHSVAIIDQDSKAFSRLSPDFSGRRVTGVGMDRACLRQANIKDAYAFAAVSSGDNSNIIAARVAREVFHVDTWWPASTIPRAPISTSAWASPTVASVQRTAESVLRRTASPGCLTHLVPPNRRGRPRQCDPLPPLVWPELRSRRGTHRMPGHLHVAPGFDPHGRTQLRCARARSTVFRDQRDGHDAAA